MSMSERVARLRQQSLDAVPSISTERAELMTKFYQQNLGLVSAPVLRALAFQYLLEHKTIYIGAGESIVGEKGPTPKATPTYPELCCHTLDDLDILDSRGKISFAVSPEARRVYEETIIPFWQGKSMRDLIFREMSDRSFIFDVTLPEEALECVESLSNAQLVTLAQELIDNKRAAKTDKLRADDTVIVQTIAETIHKKYENAAGVRAANMRELASVIASF